MTETSVFTCLKCQNPLVLPGAYGDVTNEKIKCPVPSCGAVNVVTRKGDKITHRTLGIDTDI
jgi:hypothetical protein